MKILILLSGGILLVPFITDTSYSQAEPTIKYRVFEQRYGWHPWTNEGHIVGQEGKQLEAICIMPIDFPPEAHIEYRVYVQSIGWQSWERDGQIAGGKDKGLRIEAFQARLIELPDYSICGWVTIGEIGVSSGTSRGCDGRTIGATGYHHSIQEVRVEVLPR